MNNHSITIFVIAGIFVGNVLVYGAQGSYIKGAIIGLIAAVQVLCVYYAAYYIATGKFR